VSLGATSRLSRLLAMVPWLLQRQGIPLAEAAAHFEISEEQLVKDLELLFVCGTPGHLPDDLIDADWESGRIYLRNADAISRPLRLSMDEAVALLVGLRTLADVPGLHDADHEASTVQSVITKLSAAAGDATAAAGSLSVDLSQGADQATLGAVRDAVRRRRRIFLRYLVPSRDETTQRHVDPVRVLNVAGQWYLEGWCHRAEGIRRFRLDRVVEVRVLAEEGIPPDGVVSPGLDEGLFTPSPDDLLVTVELDAAARWVAEYYPIEQSVERADGVLQVSLRTASPDWLPRLALRLGGAMRVLAPDDVAARVAELADKALAAYSSE
jgi:predicted DNA-binding transcriptional regulator YafY